MDSSATFKDHAKILPKEESDNSFPAVNRPSARRTNSFSSSSSCSSSFRSSYLSDESPLISPATPLKFSGVPFSWEKLPGIPKKQTPEKKDPTLSILPLPPPATPPTSKRFTFEEIGGTRKKNTSESFRRDPFFAAFVECCKDDDGDDTVDNFWKGTKMVPRNLSDRFGFFNLSTSCKSTCAVSESIIYLPRSSRSSDHLWNRRSG